MTTRIYAWDDNKISSSKRQKLGLGTFANKEALKKAGMQYDPEVKMWFTETPDFLDKKSIDAMGIILDEGIALAMPHAGERVMLGNFERKGTFKEGVKFRKVGTENGRDVFDIDVEKPTAPIAVVSEKTPAAEHPIKVVSEKRDGKGSNQNAYFGEVQKHRDQGDNEETARKHADEAMKSK